MRDATLNGSCDAWALAPEALAQVLVGTEGRRVFAALQRPWRWQAGLPQLSARHRAGLEAHGTAHPTVAKSQISSDAGLVPQIAALGALERRPRLAVSLNATTDELRSELMPINRRYPLASLRAALVAYPCRPRERITVEYVLLGGVNDGPDDAARLADFCAGFSHHVNVIPFNEHPGSRFRAPSETELDAFVRTLLRRRPTLLTVRRSRGRDIEAARGQLARLSSDRRLPVAAVSVTA